MAKKYGYKPKSLSLKGLTIEQLREIRRSPTMKIFGIPFGRHRGENRAADNVPWAGSTEGAETTAEAIEKIRAINPTIADNCARFAAAAKPGVTGTVYATYAVDGVEVLVPAGAAARGMDSGKFSSTRAAISV